MAELYTDLEIRVRSWDAARGAFPVEATIDGDLSSGGELRQEPEPPQPGSPPEEYGAALSNLLFNGNILKAYQWAEARADQRTEGRLRIRLSINDGAPELQAIPWERLAQPSAGQPVPLATLPDVPFSRHVPVSNVPFSRHLPVPGEPSKREEWPIRLLFAIANPSDLADNGLTPIPVKEEVDRLSRALGDLGDSQLEVTLLADWTDLRGELRQRLAEWGYRRENGPVTLDKIVSLLDQQPGYHILHFLGHGALVADTAFLYLEDADGTVDAVSDTAMAERLNKKGLRLVFLAACESASRPQGADLAYVGLAPKLVQAELPAVVAMQRSVSMDAAAGLTKEFYKALLTHGVVDRALNDARRVLFDRRQDEWATPVLFMQLPDGCLLEPPALIRALQAIKDDERLSWLADGSPGYLPLPLEVLHLSGKQDHRAFARPGTPASAAIPVEKAITDLWLPAPDGAKAKGHPSPRLTVLVGGFGSNKTTQLKRTAWQTARDALKPGAKERILPLYVGLEQHAAVRRGSTDLIADLIHRALETSCPGLSRPERDTLIARALKAPRAGGGPALRLRLLIDDNLTVAQRQRREAAEELVKFIQEYPQHQVLLASDPAYLDRDLYPGLDVHILIIQPLERRKVRHFLHALVEKEKGKLLERWLDEHALFDVVAVPKFLVWLVQHAESAALPTSRTEFFQQAICELLGDLPPEIGGYDYAEAVLSALAWRMQTQGTVRVSLADLFECMSGIRGNRDFDLEELYRALIKSRLLARDGMDSVRFAHDHVRAYWCARAIVHRPDGEARLDDITASLGRLTRLRWWEDTLILVCGLLAREEKRLERLLEVIIYGVDLLHADQAFLAARCLVESKRRGGESDIMQDLEIHVRRALCWLLNNRNEPRSLYRAQAALLLGQLGSRDVDVVTRLFHTAYGLSRTDEKADADYDYANVRMAAVVALLQVEPAQQRRLLMPIAPALGEVLRLWRGDHVAGLVKRLQQSEDLSATGVAALALGDLQAKLALSGDKRATVALQALHDAFFEPGLHQATLWAVAYALTIVDFRCVKTKVIDDFFGRLDTSEPPLADPSDRLLHLKCMGYLIGLLHYREEGERISDFLLRTCMKQTDNAQLAGVAMSTMGELADARFKAPLEDIALGSFKKYLPLLRRASAGDQAYLQRKAVEVLATVGDLGTVTRLRNELVPKCGDPLGLDPLLEAKLYQTSEEIFWRSKWGR